MKLLDRYIFGSFVRKFISSFAILMMIFIFQMIWLFIDDLAGKGLDIFIIGKFVFYMLPDLTEKVLPLTVLLASILTFGEFAEHYEFAAMKASGISLQRAMRSLIILVSVLGVVTFFFANNVIPVSKQKSYSLRRNIAKLKPSVALTEGVFSDFSGTGMTILVDEKYGVNDRYLRNVTIHKKTAKEVNSTVIKAKSGEFISTKDSNIIQLVLYDGTYYEDLQVTSNQDKRKRPFAFSAFETYVINIDLNTLQDVDLNEDVKINSERIKKISQLITDMDSIQNSNRMVYTALSNNIRSRMNIELLTNTAEVPNDTIQKLENHYGSPSDMIKDTIKLKNPTSSNEVLEAFTVFENAQILNVAKNKVFSALNTIEGKQRELQVRDKIYNVHVLEIHKKFSLALSCIILFFVGAPLGAIIRKGGLGLPMIIAITLFLTYYFLGVFSYNYAKEGNISAYLGAWIPSLVMFPLGVFLTIRATNDKGILQLNFSLKKIPQLICKFVRLKKQR